MKLKYNKDKLFFARKKTTTTLVSQSSAYVFQSSGGINDDERQYLQNKKRGERIHLMSGGCYDESTANARYAKNAHNWKIHFKLMLLARLFFFGVVVCRQW